VLPKHLLFYATASGTSCRRKALAPAVIVSARNQAAAPPYARGRLLAGDMQGPPKQGGPCMSPAQRSFFHLCHAALPHNAVGLLGVEIRVKCVVVLAVQMVLHDPQRFAEAYRMERFLYSPLNLDGVAGGVDYLD